MPREIFLGSISVQPEVMQATRILEEAVGGGYIEELQIILEQHLLTQEAFSHLLEVAFHTTVRPQDIPFNSSPSDERDLAFAQQFDYVLTYLASARFTGGFLEAWVGPALLYKDHPLAFPKGKNNLHLVASRSPLPFINFKEDVLVPEDQVVSAHYVRFTVEDKPLVLYHLAQAIADQNINICEVRQPERKKTVLDPHSGLIVQMPEEEIGPAEIAFLLDPCKVERVNTAVSAIRELPVCLAVNAVYKVKGNPTRDLSRR